MTDGGYSTSYRWAGVTRAKVAGLIAHDARDVDRRNGIEVTHSNPAVDPRRTSALNETLVSYDGGPLRPLTNSFEFLAAIDRNADAATNYRTKPDGTRVQVKLREDAAVAIEFVLMLDPEYTGEVAAMSAAKLDETKRLLDVMVGEVRQVVGADTPILVAKHFDETHPHYQVITPVPLGVDGQLSMKKFFGGGESRSAAQRRYVELHDRMRERLRGAGYNATAERVAAGRRHVGLDAFKKMKQQEAATAARLEAVERRNAAQLVANQDGVGRLAVMASRLNTRQNELDEREREIVARQVALDEREQEIATRWEAARREGYAAGKSEGYAAGKAELSARTKKAEDSARELKDARDAFAMAWGEAKADDVLARFKSDRSRGRQFDG